jgi:polygalacturonase
MPAVELRSCRNIVVDDNRVKNADRLVMADEASAEVQASR